MRKHTISIRDRRATVDDRLLVSGTWRADCVALDLDAEWEGMDVSVAFEGAGYRIEPPAEPDGTYVVPWECVSDTGGVTVSVRGTDGRQTLAHVVMDRPLVTEPGGVHVEPGATDPTVTEYQRAYRGAVEATGRADEAARGADASRDRADAAEVARAGAEADRVAAELQRAGGEAARAGAEDARESAEQGRVNAEKARAESEESRVSAEADRESVETERVTAEAERGRAEDGRKAKEAERASAEAERKSTEDARKGAETARAKAEQARAEAEAARVSAEAARENRLENAVGESRRKYITEVGITTLEPGQRAAASIEQKQSNAKLNLSIPKGAKGDKGEKGVDGVRPLSGMGVVVDDAGHCDIDVKACMEQSAKCGGVPIIATLAGGWTGSAVAIENPFGVTILQFGVERRLTGKEPEGNTPICSFATSYRPNKAHDVFIGSHQATIGSPAIVAHWATDGTVTVKYYAWSGMTGRLAYTVGSLAGIIIPCCGGGCPMINLWQSPSKVPEPYAVAQDGSISVDTSSSDKDYSWWPCDLRLPIGNTWLERGKTYRLTLFGDWPQSQCYVRCCGADGGELLTSHAGASLTVPQETAEVSFCVHIGADSVPRKATARPMLTESDGTPDAYLPYYYPDLTAVPVAIPEL